jgi:hypothetical protein
MAARSLASAIFASVAIVAGTLAFLIAGIKGHGAGWEMLIIFTLPAVGCAPIAFIAQRSKLSYAALGGAALGVLGLLMGS